MNLTRLMFALKNYEGTGPIKNGRYFYYTCPAGKLTIGIGRNLQDRGLSGEEVKFLLENDIKDSIEDCNRLFTNFESLDDVRQEVLVNMMFNLGYDRLSKFRNMIKAISINDYIEAGKQMKDSSWYNQVGKRAKDLVVAMTTGKFA